jgi:hypothetical protein
MTTQIDPDRFYSPKELAAVPGMPSEQTLAAHRCRGGGFPFRRISRTGKGGKIIYLGREVLEHLEGTKATQTPPGRRAA